MTDVTTIDAIRFRAGTLDDIPRFAQMIAGADLPPLFIAEFIGGFVAAERGGEIIACGGIEMYEQYAVIRSVVVDPAARSLGLGSAISERLESAARAAGATDIYLFTADAIEFWKRRGYVEVTFDEWAKPPRLCWQYQFITQNQDLVGIAHPMWRKA